MSKALQESTMPAGFSKKNSFGFTYFSPFSLTYLKLHRYHNISFLPGLNFTAHSLISSTFLGVSPSGFPSFDIDNVLMVDWSLRCICQFVIPQGFYVPLFVPWYGHPSSKFTCEVDIKHNINYWVFSLSCFNRRSHCLNMGESP